MGSALNALLLVFLQHLEIRLPGGAWMCLERCREFPHTCSRHFLSGICRWTSRWPRRREEVVLAIIDGVVTWSSLCKLSFSETRAVSGWMFLCLGRGLESCEREAAKKGAADVCRVEASLWFCLDYCMKAGIILVFILTRY